MPKISKLKVQILLRKNAVLIIAFFAALITCFLVPPDKEYAGYFDFKTLSCLFMTLAVVCALGNINFFTFLSRKIVRFTGNLRSLSMALVIITFIGSMLIANDMALITFLPLGYFALYSTKNEKYAAFVFILQNISANLGGMLTPFGNPQNLYLYSKFSIPTGEFTLIMLPPFLLAVALLMGCCMFLKATPLEIEKDENKGLNIKKALLFSALFILSVLSVFRVVHYLVGLAVITVALLIVDRKALRRVDYGLLLTFVMFFIFAGNMSRIDAVSGFLSELLNKNTLLVSILSCQFISNVPSAVLLSRFTSNYKALLLGVNIGGTGTLISSLASLITFNEFKMLYPQKVKKYLLLFTALNLFFLVTLTAFVMIIW
ncbi:MAG: citrate transporter [Clostridiales bacterium]|nr:citrate transporter [Candidatus Equinaster intestinalis]